MLVQYAAELQQAETLPEAELMYALCRRSRGKSWWEVRKGVMVPNALQVLSFLD